MPLTDVIKPLASAVKRVASAFGEENNAAAKAAAARVSAQQKATVEAYHLQLQDIRHRMLTQLREASEYAAADDDRGLHLLGDAPIIADKGANWEKLLLLFRALEHFRRRRMLVTQGHVSRNFNDEIGARFGIAEGGLKRLLLDELATVLLTWPERVAFYSHATACRDDALFSPHRSVNEAVRNMLAVGVQLTSPEQLPAIVAMKAGDIPILQTLDRGISELHRPSQVEALRKLTPKRLDALRALMEQASAIGFRGSISAGKGTNCWLEACRYAEALPIFAEAISERERSQKEGSGQAATGGSIRDRIENDSQLQGPDRELIDIIVKVRRRFGEKAWLGVFAKGMEFAGLVADPTNENRINAIGEDAVESFTLVKLREVLKLSDTMAEEFMANFNDAIEEWGQKRRDQVLAEIAARGEELDRPFVLCVERWRDRFYRVPRIKVITRFIKSIYAD